MQQQDRVELAKIAYRAYGETTDFKNFRGDPMPEWDDLGDKIQAAWLAASSAAAGARPATSAEDVAQRFHEAYERLAPEHGYETRKASAKPWSEVPEQNRGLMVATVQALIDDGTIRA